nr:serine/threonine protein kinase [Anaerolineales bacterium]
MENLQPGQDLGPYRIIGQIGQGGMATVYKAYHAAMDRYVAIKVLPHQLADNAEFAGRFQQEARTIARLEHARILPVYDSGTGAGLPYLVMRYLEAGTLKERMQASLLSLAEVDRLFTQLAEALEYAHRQGVIHRDLKPSNAMLDAQGNLFLTDFGIAKLLEGGAQFTNTGAMMGTPAYMSPEQAQGDKVDQRTDIYSLGIILYELTTGRVPFEAETPLAVVLKQINSPLPPPSSIKPDLAPGIERVLLKALAKEPADRFASVADFLAAWKQALAGAETLAAPRPASPATVVAAAAPATLAAAPPPVSEAGAVGGQAAARPFPLAAVLGGVAVVVVLGILFAVFAPGLLAPAATATPAQSPAATRPSSLPAEEPAVTAAAA